MYNYSCQKLLNRIWINLFIAITVFFISLWLLNYYTNGDQIYYIPTYETIGSMPLRDAYIYYNNSLSSKEFVHFFLSWLASEYINKDIFIATFNTLLGYFIAKLLMKWRVNLLIIFSIVFLNFYFIVLYTGAERLKFSILFFIISFYYIENRFYFILFSILAVLSHVQIMIIYGAILFYYFYVQLRYAIKFLKIKKLVLYLIFIILIIISLTYQQLYSKILSYFNPKSIFELFQWSVFLFFSLVYSKNKIETFMVFFILGIITLIVGGDRTNMMSYFVFLFYGLQYKQGLNFGMIMISIYLFLKSILFINSIYTYGDGFYKAFIF